MVILQLTHAEYSVKSKLQCLLDIYLMSIIHGLSFKSIKK